MSHESSTSAPAPADSSTAATSASVQPAIVPEGRKSLGSFLSTQIRQVGLLIALIVIVVLMQALTGGDLLTPRNITSIINQNAYVLILAIGMVMIIIAGHIDLSVGSVVAFVGAITGVMAVNHNWPWWAAVLGGLVCGALIGAWQGFWVAYVGIPAFIVTLAGMLTFRGLAQMVLHNLPITPFPAKYVDIGAGFLPDISGGSGYFEPLTVILGVLAIVAMLVQAFRERRAKSKLGLEDEPVAWFYLRNAFVVVFLLALTLTLAHYKGTPIILVILGLLIVIYSTVMGRTVFGRQVYARGGNLHAAQLSGIDTRRVDFLLFVNMGLLAAIAGIAFTARSNTALPGAGNGFELDAIAAVFIGGAAVTGGVGTVIGSMIGGLIMGVLNSGMNLMGLGTEVQSFIKGFVLLLAVAFDIFNKRRATSAE